MLLNTDESEVLETTDTDEVVDEIEVGEEDFEEIRAKAARADELEKKNKQLFERLKKEEKKDTPKDTTLSQKDIIALARLNADDDDIDEIVSYANAKGLSIGEAAKSNYIQYHLKEKAEQVKTAQVTSTSGVRGISRKTPEDILRHAEKTGEVPDTDEGMLALAQARLDRRRKK